MFPVTISRGGVLLAVVLVALIFVAVALVRPGANASHAPGAVSLLYIDTDTTGNTATTLGTVDDCATLSGIGTLLDVDIAIADWPANGDALAGFQMLLSYDPAVVQMSAWEVEFLLADEVWSNVIGSRQDSFDPEPDSDGTLALWAADVSQFVNPPGADEASAGVLARVTLEGVGAGQTTLSITSTGAYLFPDESLGSHVPVTQVNNAFVAVDQGCTPGPQPGPPPPPVPTEACSDTQDSDGDDFSDCVENFIGTNPLLPCSVDRTRNNEPPPDGWPVDYDDDAKAGSFDFIGYLAYLHDSPPAYDARWDLTTDGIVNVNDLLIHRKFGLCTPVPDTDGDGQLDPVDACPATFTSWTTPLGDTDCDSFLDTIESFVVTDSADSCANTAAADDEADDRWPADTNDDQFVNVFDVVPYIAALNSVAPGPPYTARLDLSMDGNISVFDVVPFIQLLNEACLP